MEEDKLSLKNDLENGKNVTEIENGMANFSIIGEGCQERKSRSHVSWDDYFMAVAFLTAMRSKDPATQVGACIVNQDKKIVGIGYNGMPSGCKDDELPWAKESSDPLYTKYMYVCHAELNAIMNKNSSDLKGCKIYVALFPCNECAKLVIQAGIREVIYFSDKHSHKPETIASKLLMDLSGVKYRKHNPSQQQIKLDFKTIDKNWSTVSENGFKTITSPTEHCRDINKARLDYLAWGEYFMAMAFLSALRSKDPSTQVGACIVNKKNKIVGIGYNGMPLGCCDNLLPWGKTSTNRLQTKYMYVCHADRKSVV